ncbi:MAG: hypothetical protein NDF54_04955 [archaeon GB-1867-035]|nr:hypothetical protein [Candidatus Culexmicrobium profundum]
MSKNSIENMMKEYSEALVTFFETFGKIITMIGKLEKKTGKNTEEMMKEFLKPETLVELSKKVPPEIFGEMMSLILEIATMKSKDIVKLTPEEKIKLGSKFLNLAKRLKKLLKELEAIE